MNSERDAAGRSAAAYAASRVPLHYGLADGADAVAMLLAGEWASAVLKRDGKYVAWTRVWEGPARPDYPAARADLLDRIAARRAALSLDTL